MAPTSHFSPPASAPDRRIRLRDAEASGNELARRFPQTASGFGNYQAMRRAFVEALGVTPGEYRRRFGAADNDLQPAI
jgi:transcriptional regulator GlxA family with amidase domain